MNPSSTAALLERLSSGIPGLDVVLGGGFFRSGVYIIHGLPGSGKTIFANQLCYRHVGAGGRAVYVTLLAESHARMLQHIRPLAFFNEKAVPDELSYISAFHDLETDGLKGLMAVLRREMRARNVSVLVLDGLVAAAEAAQTDRELKKFIHELQTSAVFHGCTVFLLTSGSPQRVNAEHTMVDGLIELEDQLFDARTERAIQVRKFRGGGSLRGKHPFRISDDGLQVYPRIESLFRAPPEAGPGDGVHSTGIPSLDALIAAGGLPARSVTVVAGTSGTGKTTMGLHFLSQCTPQEPGMLFGFFEAPYRLRTKARAFGMDLESLEACGALRIQWHSQGEHVLDELAHHLVSRVCEHGVKRLVIDGLSGFFEASVFPERSARFFSCLANELRRLGTTVMVMVETREPAGHAAPLPFGISGFVDNMVFLRLAEAGVEVKRQLGIAKMRDSDFDPGLHEMKIGASGIGIAGPFSLDDAALRVDPTTGQAR